MTRARRTSALFAAALIAVGACTGGGADTAKPSGLVGTTPGAVPAAAATAAAPSDPVPTETAPSADAAALTELTRAVVLADKVGDICREKLSAKFVMTVFKTIARCKRTWLDHDEKADAPTGVAVSDIRVRGAAATATVTLRGGAAEGVTGTWAFLRADDVWRVAAWGVDFRRSGYKFDTYRPDGPEDPLGYPAVQTCLTAKFEAMSDDAFTKLDNGLNREDKRAVLRLQEDVLDCARVPDAEGITTFRRLFEVGVRKGMKTVPDATFDCVTQRLRKTLPDEEIIKGTAAWQKTGVYPPDLRRKAFRAGYDCAAKLAKLPATTST